MRLDHGPIGNTGDGGVVPINQRKGAADGTALGTRFGAGATSQVQGLHIGFSLHYGGVGKAAREVDLFQIGAAGCRTRLADEAAEHAQFLVQAVRRAADEHAFNVGVESHFLDAVTPASAVADSCGDFCTGTNPGTRVVLDERKVHRTGQGEVATGCCGADAGVEPRIQRVSAPHQILID